MSTKLLSKIAPVPADAFVASGASHAPGFVPDPPATAGSTKYLREDATWAVPAGGSATPGGSDTQLQYNSSGSFAGSSALTTASTVPLTVAYTSTDYTNTAGANSHILLTNPSATGQTSVTAYINGSLAAKWRTDYQGNIQWVAGATGSHSFYVQGDYPSGLNAFRIENDGRVRAVGVAVGVVPMAVTAIASQTANLQEWQASSGSALASVSAAGALSFPHLACNASAPTAASGTGAGNGTPTVTVTGTDHSGTLAFTAGASAATAATVMTVTFNAAFAAAPKAVLITPANAATQALAVGAKPFISAISTTTFTMTSGGTALTNAGAYKWYYLVL